MTDVTVSFLDVGQGDATVVIDHEERTALLIDCPSWAAGTAVDEIESHGARLDTVIVTHSHQDHFGGVLDAVSALGGCRRVLYNHDTLIAQPPDVLGGRPRSHPAVVATLRRLLEFRSDQLGPATAGTSGEVGRAMFSLLAPAHRDLTRAVVNRRANAGSGVVLLEVDGVRILVGGDADEETWRRLLRDGLIPEVLAARWPHHAADLDSKGAQVTGALLAQLQADVVAVSVGSANGYGHPSDSFLKASSADRCTVMCTGATEKCSPGSSQPCAATIRVRISGGAVSWDPTPAAHRSRIRLFSSPRCL